MFIQSSLRTTVDNTLLVRVRSRVPVRGKVMSACKTLLRRRPRASGQNMASLLKLCVLISDILLEKPTFRLITYLLQYLVGNRLALLVCKCYRLCLLQLLAWCPITVSLFK